MPKASIDKHTHSRLPKYNVYLAEDIRLGPKIFAEA